MIANILQDKNSDYATKKLPDIPTDNYKETEDHDMIIVTDNDD